MRVYECGRRRRGLVCVSANQCFIRHVACGAGSARFGVLPRDAGEIHSCERGSDGMSEMRVVLHGEIPEGEEFPREWNGLVEAMEQPEVFYTWEWAAAVARVYGASRRPLLFAAYREERLAGVAALAEDANGEISFLTATTADYCDFVSAPGDREELIGLVMRELGAMGAGELRLASLPADSASAPVLPAAARKAGYAVFASPAYFCAPVAFWPS